MRSERVLFVLTQGGHRADGGLESATQLIENLEEIDPVVLTHVHSSYTICWRRLGAETHVRPSFWAEAASRAGFRGWRAARFVQAIGTNIRMWRFLRRERVAVVHFNDIQGFLAMGVGARVAGAKLVFNVRNVKEEGSYKAYWQLAVILSSRLVLLSHDMARRFEKRMGGRRVGRKVEVVYSGVRVLCAMGLSRGGPSELREELGIDDSVVALGCVAAVTPRKGQLGLIEEVLPHLKDLGQPWHMYFLGDHDPHSNGYSRRCEDAVARLHLEDRVTFVGYVDDISAWYEALDLVVLASEREGLARSMIESIVSGTPVVSVDVASAREVLEGHGCGVVVDGRDLPSLGRALRDLIEDPERRKQLGERGRRVGRSLFDPVRSAERYGRIYRAVMAE